MARLGETVLFRSTDSIMAHGEEIDVGSTNFYYIFDFIANECCCVFTNLRNGDFSKHLESQYMQTIRAEWLTSFHNNPAYSVTLSQNKKSTNKLCGRPHVIYVGQLYLCKKR